ncbi:ATP-binding protein [Zophobihabitans entericus]|uniref:ATP-binding protein n=1 Tax=Zophobihabitans entericus TaxID=1635327 RepID=A0A6G9I9W2_9GAMM|nr:ATP-binding protein [Zophobihabitans entericus]QIQ21003.1 ATP-binding protein [Zophobihabitans entericus]
MQQGSLLYGERFLESMAGSIVTDPEIAIIELVANCWDAYATNVQITWPDKENSVQFKIVDNGHGMTYKEFEHIWRTLSYDRIAAQGNTVNPPQGNQGIPRTVFGKNGKGRFASFCFSSEYLITSYKDNRKFTCKVTRTSTTPLLISKIEDSEDDQNRHGTEIVGTGEILRGCGFNEENIREIIGARFLANPEFKVSINNNPITFKDISNLLSTNYLDIPEIGRVEILHIDSKQSDRTTKQHGIAWWVQGRAVGSCKWRGSDFTRILDGRTSEAKRFTFVVNADFLNDGDHILSDWSDFREDSNVWKITRELVQDKIKDIIINCNKSSREEKRTSVIESVGFEVNKLPPLSKDRVKNFIDEIIDNCPSFGVKEIIQLSGILTKLEKANSRYGLLELLHNQESNDLDSLHDILSQWSISMAKIVLDEIKNRLKLINELREKIKIAGINEVRELQPLFEKGLWMFGAQFESIEFTSNKGMTKVIRELFKDLTAIGSRNRPDFVVLPDSSVGLYARSSYDDDYNENGSEHVVIVDLKTTGLALGSKEKEQVWKYVKELKAKGYIKSYTRVDGFILGDNIESGEEELRREGDCVKITPMLYDTILTRAEKRLLSLYHKVQDAPFLLEQQEILKNFVEPLSVHRGNLDI